jgi:EAL domain-containing protein (putative c-di-GMP-specific phosphodiesterase class I)
MLDDLTNLALVRGMQEIAEALSIQTIAEFVESEEIATMLSNIGVNYAQGWHYHKAQPLLELLT